MNVKKKIVDGKVAVLYSPGFGAGWSTWADGEYTEFLLFDERLVNLLLVDNKDAIKILVDRVSKNSVYTGGLCDLEVEWIPLGTRFVVDEYDGSESIRVLEDINWYVA